MRRVTTVIIGAGHCGLAFSHCLSERGVDHVVLERGKVANTWRKERWEALRLLTPNWMSRLPGDSYSGPDPDGFMNVADVVRRLETYAKKSRAPVQTNATVLSVGYSREKYWVLSTACEYVCDSVVIATGACNVANIPSFVQSLPRSLYCLSPLDYKNPDDLPDAGVLVIGASATGVQLARELQESGRQVTLSVGAHIRAPRRYRGRDIKWWMDAAGLLDLRFDEVDDPQRVRRSPSLQLTGSPGIEMLDLNDLASMGVEVVGRLAGMQGNQAMFSGSLATHCAASDLKLNRLLDTIDQWIQDHGMDSECPPPTRPEPTRVPSQPKLSADLMSGQIRSVIFATGFRPDYNWLHMPVFDRKGRLKHEGGIVAPGLYAMGLPFMRRRKSTLIDGAAADARDLVDHMMAGYGQLAA